MPYRYDHREEHRGLAFFLAVTMHALLAAFLLISVQWQTRQPETISVELWGGPPPPPLEQAEPETVQPQPVKQPEPEPRRDDKPDIATEKVKPRPTSKPTDRPTPVPTAAPKAATLRPAPAKKAAGKEECDLTCILQKGMDKRVSAQPGEGKASGKEGGAAGGSGSTVGTTGIGPGGGDAADSLSDYTRRLTALFKSRLIYPEDNAGNPQVSLRISVLPDGSIRDVTILKASNDPAYDLAAVRAVRAVDRLPEPGRGRSFRDADLREFTVNFRLRDK